MLSIKKWILSYKYINEHIIIYYFHFILKLLEYIEKKVEKLSSSYIKAENNSI